MSPRALRPVADPGPDRLAPVAEALERTGWAFELIDAGWHVAHVSDQLKQTLRIHDDAALGVGRHVLETRALPAWEGAITEESERCFIERHLPFYLHADPGVRELVPPELRVDARDAQPAAPPPVWSFEVRFVREAEVPMRVSGLGISLREGGATLGYAIVYGPALPASLLALVLRGDEAQFDRMARLFEPRRTAAAILFADLEASTALSRRLPSRTFFAFMQALASAMDREVLARDGIIGKHAGDGVTAFFTAEDVGSPAGAAAAAIEAARAIAVAARTAAREHPTVARLLDEPGCAVNAGLHWGGGLYMGQLVTGGRLEVTALGDEVNECARIEQAARGGALLASKALLEQLDDDAAAELALDPGGLIYRPVSELPFAGAKVTRDAGGIPVADVAVPSSAQP
jgi:class 3 adenylate cyclase